MLFMILPTPERTQEVAAEVFKLLDEKIMTPQSASKTIPIEHFQDAVELLETQGRGGKLMLLTSVNVDSRRNVHEGND
ncbi:hypothetical protein Mapa_007561 [Marchantia paleacea]|nr:hypothetical protein Mapa_007561 [Marchantia paleacea]